MANLSKLYTAKALIEDIKILMNNLSGRDTQRRVVLRLINNALLKVYALLGDAIVNKYAQSQSVSNTFTAVVDSVNLVTGATYTNSTKTVGKSSHGLTNLDVGKRIFLYDANYYLTSFISSITDANNFVVEDAVGSDMTSGNYILFPKFNADYVDLSSYKVGNIIRLTDDANGECYKVDSYSEFDCLSDKVDRQNHIYWYREGETLYLYKGSNIDEFGNLTLRFNRLPNFVTSNSDYLDCPDEYIPFLTGIAKAMVYESMSKKLPDELEAFIQSRIEQVRQLNPVKEEKMKEKE